MTDELRRFWRAWIERLPGVVIQPMDGRPDSWWVFRDDGEAEVHELIASTVISQQRFTRALSLLQNGVRVVLCMAQAPPAGSLAARRLDELRKNRAQVYRLDPRAKALTRV